MKTTLLNCVQTVFAGAENYEPPAGYRQHWIMRDWGPSEFWEDMELYLDLYGSVLEADFPHMGVILPPEWAEVRVAASLCYLLLGHPDLRLDEEHAAYTCDDFADAYSLIDEDADLPYRELNDDQWGALLAVSLWSISDMGPVKGWASRQIPDLHTNMRSALCRMVTSRHLPELENKVVEDYIRDELAKLEQPDFAQAMKPPPY